MIEGPTMMRWVAGYEGLYLVDRRGRVFNRQAKEMAVRIDRYGYANIRLNRDGKQSWKKSHRVVCEAFHGPAPAGAHAAHRDGNTLNNHHENITWKTPRENNADKLVHGTHQAGERHPRARLSAEQVADIRASSMSSRAMASKIGVSQSQIVRIRNGTRWAEGIAKNPKDSAP